MEFPLVGSLLEQRRPVLYGWEWQGRAIEHYQCFGEGKRFVLTQIDSSPSRLLVTFLTEIGTIHKGYYVAHENNQPIILDRDFKVIP